MRSPRVSLLLLCSMCWATTAVAQDAACLTSTATWQTRWFAWQAGTFTVEFDATPKTANLDGVVGLANKPATRYAVMGPMACFNLAGFLDARNGGGYASQAVIPYSAEVTYHFRLVVNVPAHTYSIYVRSGSSPEQLLGGQFAFAAEQQTVSALATLNLYASSGTLTVCPPVISSHRAGGSVYYVDPVTGNNANSGTSSSSPWQTPPGTRTLDNSAFAGNAWGAITASNKIACADTILLKGGSTQTASQGGGWRIDNGPNNDGTGFYQPGCQANAPITIRVAAPSEWPGSSGHFTLNGAGVTSTCLFGCGYTHGLVHVQDIDSLVLGGNSADQRLRIEQAQGAGVTAHNLLVTSRWNSPTPTARFIGQWLEVAGAQNDGIGVGPARHFIIRDTIAHDNGWSGFSTGNLADNHVVHGAFQDVEAFRNGPQHGSLGDQFLFLGCEACYVVRATSHDGYLRGLNFGNIGSFNGINMFLLIRDSEFWNNGLSSDDQAVYQSGPCWSGNDNIPTAQQFQRGVMQRSVIASNREGGGPCAYGQGWAEVWNSVWWNNGYDKRVGGQGDITLASQADTKRLAVYNSIVQKQPDTLPWTASAPSGFGLKRCPVSNYNLYRPVANDSEALSDFTCIGTSSFSLASRTFANPPAFMGPNDKIGGAWTIGFAAIDGPAYQDADFHLTAGSSAIDGGTYMMRANGSGTNASVLNVLGNGGSNNPRHYFLAPTSYYQVTADTIQIKGATCQNALIELGSAQRARVAAMTQNSILLDRVCTWPSGAGIHLPWNGVAPDMGAFEFGN